MLPTQTRMCTAVLSLAVVTPFPSYQASKMGLDRSRKNRSCKVPCDPSSALTIHVALGHTLKLRWLIWKGQMLPL